MQKVIYAATSLRDRCILKTLAQTGIRRKGGSIQSLSKVLGHSSVATTLDLYGTESIDDVQENYERLIEVMFG